MKLFGWKKKQPDGDELDRGLAVMMASAEDLASQIIALAPDDRTVSMDELRRVEDFVVDMCVASAREASPSLATNEMIVAPLERKFREAFASRYYQEALATTNIAIEGEA